MAKKQVNVRLSQAGQEKLEALAQRYGTTTGAMEVAIDRLYSQEAAMAKVYEYEVTFINGNGEQVTRTVTARHEFEATQLAGATGTVVISVVNLDQ